MLKRPVLTARRATRGALLVLALLMLAVVWIVFRGLEAQGDLERGRSSLSDVRRAVGAGDAPAARIALTKAQAATSEAHALTSDPVWRVAGAIPWLGASAHSITTAAAVTDNITSDVLPSVVAAGGDLGPSTLRVGGRVNLAPFIRIAPVLDRALSSVNRQRAAMDEISGPLPGPIARGVRDLRSQLHELSDVLATATSAAQLLPPLLGESGPRRYLIVIQNPAEARGTGGIIGAYGVLEALDGKVRLREMGSNGKLVDAARLPVDLGPDFLALYGHDPAIWTNANLSPHFPYAARIWLALWARQRAERLDGVIAIDAVGLGHIVRLVEPVKVTGGTTLNGDNAARFIMQDAYRRFPLFRDNAQRDKLLVSIGESAVTKLLASDTSSKAIVSALQSTVREHRLSVYSIRDAEQKRLLSTAISGALPQGRRAFLAVVLNNGGANKLDVYLRREVTWQRGQCDRGQRLDTVTVRLKNGSPASDLPPYVVGKPIYPTGGGRALPRGSNRLLMNVFTSPSSHVTGAALDGQPVSLQSGKQRRMTVTGITIDLTPGSVHTFVMQYREPSGNTSPLVLEQPMVIPQHTEVHSVACNADR